MSANRRQTGVWVITPPAGAAERRAAILSLIVGIVLLGVKFAAYYLTSSAAIFSDALENIVNVLASGFALYSIWLAHRPADKEHPYGHGKIEFLSAGFEGGMIVLAAVLIAARAADAFIHGGVSGRLDWALILMAAAMLVNGGLGLFLKRSGAKHGSLTLEADGIHLLTDAITSAAVILALIGVKLTGWRWLDPSAALLVAVYISWIGARLLRQAAAGLMDEQDIEDTRLLRRILDSHVGPNGKDPRICSYHKLRHRHSGRYHWVDFHIMVPAKWDIDQGHRVASNIEYEIECALGEGNATAHVEPCAEENCSTCESAKASV